MATDMTMEDQTEQMDPSEAAAETEGKDPARLALVDEIQKRIKADKAHHKDAFRNMRQDMYMARHGKVKENSDEDWYVANIAGRHVKQKTAALYAKNPRAIARRRKTLDFKVWDEEPKSLEMAFKVLAQAQQFVMANPQFDPNNILAQQAMQAFQRAQETVADYQQGMQKRELISKIGKTLEILFDHATNEQKPLTFKAAAKQLVRRACTTGVAYVELGFQREYGPRPAMEERMADFRTRLEHLRNLAADGEIEEDDDEKAELELAMAALQAEPEIILREGLIFDFPQSTKVIPDKMTKQITGFVGARWLTLEYAFTCDQVEEIFEVEMEKYTGSTDEEDETSPNIVEDEGTGAPIIEKNGKGKLVKVWKHYDKASGLVYYVANGYPDFLREPTSPDVFVEDFWPVYALTFNEVESEDELFPPSDVRLIRTQQLEYNRARNGMRVHRRAAQPRWVSKTGSIEPADMANMQESAPFTVTNINLPQGAKVDDVLQPIKVPGVDPNLYETNQLFTDVQLTVGSSEAQFGATANATATESVIAANATSASDQASVDDLDTFLSMVARASGQILMREMSEDKVMEVAGVGAVWPEMTISEILNELYLDVQAGSTGKPNQAVEINNWKTMLPFLTQMPGINPTWLARETVRRLDDNVDLTEALTSDMPSIMAQNAMTQMSAQAATTQQTTAPGGPQDAPAQQGDQGRFNTPAESGAQPGSDAPMGNNRA